MRRTTENLEAAGAAFFILRKASIVLSSCACGTVGRRLFLLTPTPDNDEADRYVEYTFNRLSRFGRPGAFKLGYRLSPNGPRGIPDKLNKFFACEMTRLTKQLAFSDSLERPLAGLFTGNVKSVQFPDGLVFSSETRSDSDIFKMFDRCFRYALWAARLDGGLAKLYMAIVQTALVETVRLELFSSGSRDVDLDSTIGSIVPAGKSFDMHNYTRTINHLSLSTRNRCITKDGPVDLTELIDIVYSHNGACIMFGSAAGAFLAKAVANLLAKRSTVSSTMIYMSLLNPSGSTTPSGAASEVSTYMKSLYDFYDPGVKSCTSTRSIRTLEQLVAAD